jgi:hypothetical protein
MSPDDHMVEPLEPALAVVDHHTLVRSPDPRHASPQAHVVDRARQPFDIAAAAAVDGPPSRPPGQLQEPMVAAEPDEGFGRVVQQRVRRRGPDGRRHRQQVVVPERFAEALAFQVVAQRKMRVRQTGQVPRRFAIEAQDFAQHRPEARP